MTPQRPLLRLELLFFFQAEDGIRDIGVTGVQTCALPILPVAMVGGVGSILYVRNSLDVRTFQQLLERARQRPGELTYGSAGNGGASHLAMALDRKSVVSGKSVDLGGRRILKKKKSRIT